MLLAHIINLHTGQRSESKSLLKGKSRMIGVYMYLYNLIICHQNNRVTDRHKEFLEFVLCLLRHWLIQKNNELCAVTEFNILLCLCINFGHCRTLGTAELCIIHFFAQIAVISSMENLYQSLSA